jgi:hypothetical protein
VTEIMLPAPRVWVANLNDFRTGNRDLRPSGRVAGVYAKAVSQKTGRVAVREATEPTTVSTARMGRPIATRVAGCAAR